MLKNYELLVAFSEETPEAAQKELIDEISKIIEKAKGNLGETETWGKRALAFQIGKNKSGFYWLVNFTGEGNLPKVITDALRIEDSVLRFLVTEKEKPVKVDTKKKAKKPATKKLDELVVR